MTVHRVFDAHSHAFPDFLAKGALRSLLGRADWWDVQSHHDGTIAGLTAAMERAGIEKAILCSVATRPTQVTGITDWSVAIASTKIVPFASIHPDFESPEREIERIASLGLRGIKFHPEYMDCSADDPRTLRIARAAAGCGLAMTMHAGYDPGFPKTDIASPTRIRRLLDAVPGLRLLACHLGGFLQWEEALEVLIGRDVYIDTSFCLGACPEPLLRAMVARHPPTHLLFGSDSPWTDSAVELEKFNQLGLTPENLSFALWDNAHVFAGLRSLPAPRQNV